MSAMSNIDAILQEMANAGQLYVWYVQGSQYPDVWLTKLDAEKRARELFPDEPAQQRYARVMCRRVQTY